MRIHRGIPTGFMVALFGITSLGISSAGAIGFDFFKKDQSVCYALVEDNQMIPEIVLRLNVKKHSDLTTHKEKRRFDHPLQTTYSAMGKSIDALFGSPLSMGEANGTVTVAKKTGARIAFSWSHLIDPWSGAKFTANVECSSVEASPTPQVWSPCTVQFFDGMSGDISTETKYTWRQVNPLQNRTCSEFPEPPLPNSSVTSPG